MSKKTLRDYRLLIAHYKQDRRKILFKLLEEPTHKGLNKGLRYLNNKIATLKSERKQLADAEYRAVVAP